MHGEYTKQILSDRVFYIHNLPFSMSFVTTKIPLNLTHRRKTPSHSEKFILAFS